jgi:predicted esterase
MGTARIQPSWHCMGGGRMPLTSSGWRRYLCGGRCLVLCPQGPLQIPLGPSGPVGYAWFPSTGGGPPDMTAVQAAYEAVQTFLDAALARYPCDPTSSLSLALVRVGSWLPFRAVPTERFAALVALSTWLPPQILERAPNLAAAQHLPIMVQHGSRDSSVDVGAGLDSRWRSYAPCRLAVTYREYDMGHEISGRSLYGAVRLARGERAVIGHHKRLG